MKRYIWPLILFSVIAVLIVVIRSFSAVDIRADVGSVEGRILSVLRDRGVAERDVVSRTEEEWRHGRIKGRTLGYVFESGSPPAKGLYKDISDSVKGVKRAYVKSFVYIPGRAGAAKGETNFEISLKGETVFKAKIRNTVLKSGAGGAAGAAPGAAKAPYAAAEKEATIAVVLDDFGYTTKNLADLEGIGAPITLAILPGLKHSRRVSNFARDNGMEVILHMPMEPEDEARNLEKDTIFVAMDEADVVKLMSRAFASMDNAVGMSNHMGSKATKDARILKAVFAELKKNRMFFLDSVTTEGSLCGETADEFDVPYVKRDVFLDNKLDRDAITAQMEKTVKIARRYGKAVVIGHDRAVTAKTLRAIMPRLEKEGIRFVKLSELIGKKELSANK